MADADQARRRRYRIRKAAQDRCLIMLLRRDGDAIDPQPLAARPVLPAGFSALMLLISGQDMVTAIEADTACQGVHAVRGAPRDHDLVGGAAQQGRSLAANRLRR